MNYINDLWRFGFLSKSKNHPEIDPYERINNIKFGGCSHQSMYEHLTSQRYYIIRKRVRFLLLLLDLLMYFITPKK